MTKTLIGAALALALPLTMPAVVQAQEGGIANPTRAPFLDEIAGSRVIYIPMAMGLDLTEGWNVLMQAQAERYGYSVEVRDANWSTESGARALTAAINEAPDLIVLQNADVQSYARLIGRAADAGIPVMQLNMESLTPSDAYVGADWQGIGEAAARLLVEQCGAETETSHQVQVIFGVPTAPADLYQIYGFRSVMEQHPEIEIVSQQAASYDPTQARAITASVLQQYPDLCGSFGIWDSMDAGTGAAVLEAGLQDQVYIVTSGGGSETSCEKLREGIFDAIVAYDVRQQGIAINAMTLDLLTTGHEADSPTTVVYTANTIQTRESLRPGSCWSMDDL